MEVFNEVERTAIEAQLERMVLNQHFSHSRRFPSFLRFVVHSVLDGKADALKERTIGVEVFGREIDYDTTADPIVRVTAAEIRKRIAQYYQEDGNRDDVRISLPSGSYVPQFQLTQSTPPAEPKGATTDSLRSDENPAQPAAPARRSRSILFAAPVILLIIAGVAWWLWVQHHQSALQRFWQPILDSEDPVLFCIADQSQFGISLRNAANPSQQMILQEKLSAVVIDDLGPIVQIAGIMDSHHHRYHVRGEATTSLTDLREGPTVLVGAFDNAWTLRLTNSLRYHFGNNPEMTRFWITDRESSDRNMWVLDRHQQETTNNYRDYGIVARFKDPNTGKISIVIAGIARGGTIAAGEFVTERGKLEAIEAKAPRNWNDKNMEIVISTEIIDGRSAPPKVEAVHFW